MSINRYDQFNMMYGFPEVAHDQDYAVATYQVYSQTSHIEKLAMAIADEQTTGTWTSVGAETAEMKKKFGARVLNIWQLPDMSSQTPKGEEILYIIQVGFPVSNFGADIPMMLSTVIGNISSSGKIKMIDISLPRSYVAKFKGPRFGIAGLRELLEVPDRPLLNAMVKPNIGWTPKQGAELFYQAAKGGCDIIKDDELMPADEPHCPLVERVKLFREMEKRVYEETGEHTLHAVNITGDMSKIRDNAYRAVEAGANCLMINVYTAGFSAVRMIADDDNINLPILGHVDFIGTMVSSPYHGLNASMTIGRFARLSGVDFHIWGTPYGKFPVGLLPYLRTAHLASQEWYDIKPLMIACSGGTTQMIVPQVIKDLGTDIIIAAGGAVHGHPNGSFAGAKSMRQAIDAAMQGIPLEEYAKTHEELAVILKTWGDPKDLFDLMK